MANDAVISVEHLSHRYGKGRVIYHDLSFEVPQGRILGLLGKNGTGKTTTINILMGYLKPHAGRCKIFGEDITAITPDTRRRIALLIEGHVQYSFMTIEQIERFYAPFYPKWNRDAYYDLMRRLKVSPNQRISSMSCGQRSQVALGLTFAQNADLLVLDDFSLGLDPGYRRLFIEYLRDFARSEGKTVFTTSHIIQDMERLIDDCIILDYGRIITQQPVQQLMSTLHGYTIQMPEGKTLQQSDIIINPSQSVAGPTEFVTFAPQAQLQSHLEGLGLGNAQLTPVPLTLEDAFIGLTGKY